MSDIKKLGPVSAYAIAVEHGFEGTEAEWLASLHPTDEQVEEYFSEHPAARVADGSVTKPKLAQDVKTWIETIQHGQTSPFNFKGSVADLTALAAVENPAQNDTYFVEAANCRYSWTGSADPGWVQSSMDEEAYEDELEAISVRQDALAAAGAQKSFTWEIGTITSAGGADYAATNRIRTVGYQPMERLSVIADTGYKIAVYFYNSSKSYLSALTIALGATAAVIDPAIQTTAAYFRICAADAADDDISDADDVSVHILAVRNAEDFLADGIRAAPYDGSTTLGNQTVNTICRLSNISGILDAPAGVDLKLYYGWMLTAGGTNKIQVLYYQHDGSTMFRSYRHIGGGVWGWTDWAGGKKPMRFLAVGNSFDQDALAYLPPILAELLPDYQVTVGVLYKASATLQDHLDMYDKAKKAIEDEVPVTTENGCYTIYDLWLPGEQRWTRYGGTHAKYLKEVLQDGWDVIATQGSTEEYYGDTQDWEGATPTEQDILDNVTANAKQLHDEIFAVDNPVAGCVHLWFENFARPYQTYSVSDVYTKIHGIAEHIIDSDSGTGYDDYIPVGTAVQTGRTSQDLNGIGNNMLHTDGVHILAGLPALLETYTVAANILHRLGLAASIPANFLKIFNSVWRPNDFLSANMNAASYDTDADTGALTWTGGMMHGNVQGVTENNVMLARAAAYLAEKNRSVSPIGGLSSAQNNNGQ